jgi:hypothetical protein
VEAFETRILQTRAYERGVAIPLPKIGGSAFFFAVDFFFLKKTRAFWVSFFSTFFGGGKISCLKIEKNMSFLTNLSQNC